MIDTRRHLSGRRKGDDDDDAASHSLMMEFVEERRELLLRQVLELARKFARKAQRPSTDLTCRDLLDALDVLNISFLFDRQ